MSKKQIVIFFVVLLFICLTVYYFSIAEWSWMILPVLLLAWFSADFLLGLGHFYLDYVEGPKEAGLKELTQHPNRSSEEYLQLRKKVMKHLSFVQQLAFEFKVHHLRPMALGKRSFSFVVFPAAIALVIPFLTVITIVIFFYQIGDLTLLFFLTLNLGFLLGQYAHANTHKNIVPRPIKWLQILRIFLTIKRHSLHHHQFDHSFCILNGWSTFLVDPLTHYIIKKEWINRDNLQLY